MKTQRPPKPASSECIATVTDTTTRNPGLILDPSQRKIMGQGHTFTVVKVVTRRTRYVWADGAWHPRQDDIKTHAKFYGPTAASSAKQFIGMMEAGCTVASKNRCAADFDSHRDFFAAINSKQSKL